MSDDRRISVPGWLVNAAVVLAAIVGGAIAFDQRYVKTAEHVEHENLDRREVVRIDAALNSHMEATRLDGAKLAAIEVQLAAIREELRWFRDRLESQKGLR